MVLQMALWGPVAAPCRVMGPPATRAHPTCSLRPQFWGLRSQVASLQCSFSGLSLRTDGPSIAHGRRSFVVEANSKTALGITKRGTRRARTRTSGFRARIRTPNGRQVLKARRKKGRKTLCPANNHHK